MGLEASDADWNYYEFPDEVIEDDMVIWIDPLDGTKGFTEGHTHHITSLIGVSINKRPRIGIIHKPFYNKQYGQGRTYFGTPECGIFVKDKFPEKLKRLQRVTTLFPFPTDDSITEKNYKLWLCGSHNENQFIMNNIIKAIDPFHTVKVAGSGNKIVYLLDENADCYLNFVPGFKYWDMCASEALLMSKMGIVTDASSRPIIYDEDKTDFTIREGIIVAKNKKVFDTMHKRVSNNLGKTLSTCHQEMNNQIAE